MCGICGSIGFLEGEILVKQMTQAMVHRGPDSAGFLNQIPVYLGVRRLRIIDLNTGDQPIYNEDQTIAVILNGEIYNFLELNRELEALGHKFATRSDTEAIVHAYEEWGQDCPKHLRGMFAFAVYDKSLLRGENLAVAEQHCRVFLARDRLGIKPLYIWQQGNSLLFASEVRALMASGCIPRQLSPAGLYTYLAFGSVQEPLTMIDGITSLPAGCWLTVDIQKTGAVNISQQRYWEPPCGDPTDPSNQDVRSWLEDAICSHLVSDVPLGVFLSGGLDSGTIVSLGSQALVEPMHTFTLAFDDWPSDERDTAFLTAKFWKTDHQVRVVNQQEIVNDLPQAIASMDQPTIDGVNSWYISREAKRAGLTVALSGVGGDELFAGYPGFKQIPSLKKILHPIHWLARLPGWQHGWPRLPGNPDTRRKLMAYISGDMPLSQPYFTIRGLFSGLRINWLLTKDMIGRLTEDRRVLDYWKKSIDEQAGWASRYDAVGEVSWMELSQYMRSTLLRDTDMMSMAHSLEVRVPFVDHLFVERILPIREGRKLASGQPKPLLVNAVRELLPLEIIHLKKRTFTLPFEVWLRENLALDIKSSLFMLSGEQSKLLNPIAVTRVWNDFERGWTNWARPWSIFVLSKWIEKNLV